MSNSSKNGGVDPRRRVSPDQEHAPNYQSPILTAGINPAALSRYLVAGLAIGVMASVAAAEPMHQVRLNGHTFTLPAGFTVELAAGPPLIERPIVADFDDEGRLYVADSSGSSDKVEVQLRERPHRIVRLDPADSHGYYQRSIEFADRLMFPEGVLWHAGALYVAAPPSIWKLTDEHGGGASDHRIEWFQGKTLTGCANDLHGPYLGPDGWIYWCKGAFARQTYDRPAREPLVTRAAHIFRARPDGSGIEPVMTGGMDNPVEVAFSSSGERFFTTTFIQHPGGGRRDGIVHAVYGGVYGKVNDAVEGHPRTSPNLMPVMAHLGPAAPSGLCRYESTAFGPEYRDNLFAALFNMRKVTRHVLVPDGATFRTQDSDFLVSDSFDFHPTDVLEDADGSLLVIDTGGWYKLCCPTSQLAKPDILGAIYRVRRIDAPAVSDPRGLAIDWEHPGIELLGDSRPAVRRRAIRILADRKAVSELATAVSDGQSAEIRRNAVWSLVRIDGPAARAAVRLALRDRDESVANAACHGVSVHRDREAGWMLRQLIERGPPPSRRAAAEALGRIGDGTAVPSLLAALAHANDAVLEHSLTFALIEIDDREQTAAGLASANATVRRCALMALDQMRDSRLAADAVIKAWRSSDRAESATAAWILARHAEWGDRLVGVFKERLQSLPKAADRDQFIEQLAHFSKSAAVQSLLVESASGDSRPTEERLLALNAMQRAQLHSLPNSWTDAAGKLLDSSALIAPAIDVLRSGEIPPARRTAVGTRLLAVAHRSQLADETRLNALAAIPANMLALDDELAGWLFKRLPSSEPTAIRSRAAEVVANARLTRSQLTALAKILPTVGPLQLERVLDAIGHSTDDDVGHRWLDALSTIKGALRVATLRPRFAKYSPAIRARAEKLFAELDAESAKQAERLEAMLKTLKPGDVRRGQAVFNSPKIACSSCHAVGYLGGSIGPDLTKIGAIRTERDLLESILFPSASFVRGYEPVTVMTKRGVPVSGIVKGDSSDEIRLVRSATEETRIPRHDVESIEPGTVSIMPSGLDQQMTEQDLADLIAFLKACR